NLGDREPSLASPARPLALRGEATEPRGPARGTRTDERERGGALRGPPAPRSPPRAGAGVAQRPRSARRRSRGDRAGSGGDRAKRSAPLSRAAPFRVGGGARLRGGGARERRSARPIHRAARR